MRPDTRRDSHGQRFAVTFTTGLGIARCPARCLLGAWIPKRPPRRCEVETPPGSRLAGVAVNPSKTSTPGWTRTSGLACRRRDPFGPRSATGSPTQYARLDSNQRTGLSASRSLRASLRHWIPNSVRPAGLEPATLGLEIPCSIHLSYGRVSFRTFSTTGPRGAQKGAESVVFDKETGPQLFWTPAFLGHAR
jgi:hypothetical protein